MSTSLAERRLALEELRRHLLGKACPTACYVHLGGLCDTLTSCDNIDGEGIREMHQRLSSPILNEFWELSFNWFTIPRTLSELRKLQATTCKCSLEKRSADVHMRGEKQLSSTKGILGKGPAIAWLLIQFLEPFTKWACRQSSDTPLRERQLNYLHHRSEWPQNLGSLLPHGPRQTTLGLLAWVQVGLTLELDQLLYHCIYTFVSFCHPLVLPIVLESEIFLNDGILRYISTQRANFIQYPENPSAHQVMRFIGLFKAISALEENIDLLLHKTASISQCLGFNKRGSRRLLYAYIQAMEICDYLNMFRNHLRQYHLDTSPLMHTIQSTMGEEHVTVTRKGFSIAGAQLVATNPEICTMMQPRISSHTMNEFVSEAETQRTNDFLLWRRVIECLHYLEVGQRCMRSGCRNTLAGNQLMSCAGCRRFLYCSRRCQKQAWIGRAAHKRICSIIATLCESCNIPRREVLQWDLSLKFYTVDPSIKVANVLLRYFADLSQYDEEWEG